jgi:hypothetical protein
MNPREQLAIMGALAAMDYGRPRPKEHQSTGPKSSLSAKLRGKRIAAKKAARQSRKRNRI